MMANDGSPLPVMVWLHGGAFVNGSGNGFYGAYLAQTAHVIVVTVNYRLGPLGWLALPLLAAEDRNHSTGNYGLLPAHPPLPHPGDQGRKLSPPGRQTSPPADELTWIFVSREPSKSLTPTPRSFF
jgi:hypothetical protein